MTYQIQTYGYFHEDLGGKKLILDYKNRTCLFATRHDSAHSCHHLCVGGGGGGGDDGGGDDGGGGNVDEGRA